MKNSYFPLYFTLIVLFIYVICLYIWQFKKFKIDFSFLRNFKYESENIIFSLFMLLIYSFGFQAVFLFREEFIILITTNKTTSIACGFNCNNFKKDCKIILFF